jgi:hypothetical protein
MIRKRAKTKEELAGEAEAAALKTAVEAFDAPKDSGAERAAHPGGRLSFSEGGGGATESASAPQRKA